MGFFITAVRPNFIAYRTVPDPCIFRVPFYIPYRTVLSTFVIRFFKRLLYRAQNFTVFHSCIFYANRTVKIRNFCLYLLKKREPYRFKLDRYLFHKLTVVRFIIRHGWRFSNTKRKTVSFLVRYGSRFKNIWKTVKICWRYNKRFIKEFEYKFPF